MKDFDLKKIKCYEEMSEETQAFSAEFWVDGNHVANVKNDGQGGPNQFQTLEPYTYKDVEPFSNLDAECEIFERVIEFDETRKNQSRGFFLKKDDKYFTQKFPKKISELKKHPQYNGWLNSQLILFKSQGYKVLNNNL